MKTFLVPFDFSPAAQSGLEYAAQLAHRTGADLLLLHVIKNEADELLKRTAVKLLLVCNTLSDKYKISVEYCSEKGNPVDIIPRVARLRKTGLIIMGSGGESTLQKIFLGSNTGGVITRAQVPVLMVPEGIIFNNIRRIVFASDFHNSDIDDLKGLVQLAAVFRAQLNVLHIYPEDMKDHWHREEMKKFIDEVQGRIDYNEISFEMIQGDEAVERLKEYLDSGGADILALATHSRKYMDKLFAGSFTDSILYKSVVPVLVYHYKKDAAVKLF
jgi:nucleotide-binding universal stress UspA family protein